MICPACNYELSVHSDACEHCGAPAYLATAAQVTDLTHCTYCGARDDTGSNACPTCGLKKNFKTSESPAGTCRNCGAIWRTAWMYCQTCGVARENGLVDATLPTGFATPLEMDAYRGHHFYAPAATSHHSSPDLYEPRDTFFASEFSPPAMPDPYILLSEHEVVERMYVNGEAGDTPGRRDELAEFFSESEIVESLRPATQNVPRVAATAPQVVYDLPTTAPPATAGYSVSPAASAPQPTRAAQATATRPVTSFKPDPIKPLASPAVSPPADVSARIPAEPAPKPKPTEAVLNQSSKTEPAAEVTRAEVKAAPKADVNPEGKPEAKSSVKSNTGPVQTVRFINRPHPMPAPPLDKRLIKVIAALIFLILVFSALIVSGFRLRDLFGNPPSKASPHTEPNVALTPSPSATNLQAPKGMVYVPGGTFRMGREDGDTYESPSYEVTVVAFFMDRTEVSNAQYAEFLKATNHLAPPDWKSGKYAAGTDKLPVVNVSWQDAKDYAAWAGKRLPTEAEWEFAARGQDARRYPWGSNWDAAKANTSESNLNRAVEVSSYAEAANPLGLLHLAGNVWEWVDGEVVSYKDTAITLAPGKVIRGGAYYLPKERATTTYRGFAPADKVSEKIGFRCVRDVN